MKLGIHSIIVSVELKRKLRNMIISRFKNGKMEERMKIVFGKPYHLPSPVHGVEVVYPYEIINARIEDKNEKTKSLKLKVLIDPHLASIWGVQFWQPSETYNGLIKLILRDVINQIKRIYYMDTLDNFEEFALITSDIPKEAIHKLDTFPEVEGFEELIV